MVEAIAAGSTHLVLRAFEPGDFAVVERWFRTADEARLWGGPLARFPVDRAQLGQMLAETIGAGAMRRCWSALLEGELVGHAQAVRETASSVRLARVAVAPERRGEGIGRSLVSTVVDELMSDPSVERVTLNVYAENDGARRLYRELGFKDAGPTRGPSLPMVLTRQGRPGRVQ